MSTAPEIVTSLQAHYVDAVNRAVAADDLTEVDRLAAEFDVEVLDALRRHVSASEQRAA